MKNQKITSPSCKSIKINKGKFLKFHGCQEVLECEKYFINTLKHVVLTKIPRILE